MPKCLICSTFFNESVSIATLLNPTMCCSSCIKSLSKIHSPVCDYCSHPSGYNCCDRKYRNISIFFENDFIKKIFYEVKKLGLVEKLFIFKPFLETLSINYKEYVVVPIPSSREQIKKRGFNQSLVLSTFLNLPVINCIQRLNNSVQSLKNRHTRINQPPIMRLTKKLYNKSIILLDDIYTTGTTLKTAAQLFDKSNKIIFITIQRTLIKSC